MVVDDANEVVSVVINNILDCLNRQAGFQSYALIICVAFLSDGWKITWAFLFRNLYFVY